MQIILSKQCESLTGSLGRGFGYVIVKRGNRFFAQRGNHNVSVPPDGHWRFIVTCAQLAQSKLHIADIKVSREEVKKALYEARCFIAMQNLRKDFYHARDILNLKTTFGL
jgi:hypothetical protein